MCVDYSKTVNKFTCLDAYPLPNMQSVNHNVTRYKWYSCLDLRSAYHQVPLLPEERKYTVFEANGQLYQFRRIPFGLKNTFLVFNVSSMTSLLLMVVKAHSRILTTSRCAA